MKEKFWIWLAWKLPKPLAYWAFVRVASYATVEVYSDKTPEEVNITMAMKAWEEKE